MSIPKEFMLKLPSGSTLPAVGLGTYAPKHTENEVFEAVRSAIKNGYRHLDCAAIYRNEQAVGQGIKKVIVEGKVTREDLFITSKLWNTCHRPDLVRTSLKKSLQDLGLKYLDLYLIHWPLGYFEGGEFHPRDETGKVKFSDVDYLDTWKALEDCVDVGLVKNIGLSNFNSQQIQRILDNCRIKPCTNQVEVHPHFSNEKLINFCQQKDIVVTAYAPLGSPGNEELKPENSESVPTHHCLEEPVVKQIAQQKNKSPAQVILRFLLQRGLAVIPKAITPNRIAEDIQLFDFELTEDNMKDMCSLNKNYRLYREDIALDHKFHDSIVVQGLIDMLYTSVFGDAEGILLKEFISKKNLSATESSLVKGVLFHQDSASVHKSVTVTAAIHDCGFNLIEHPPYSTDLAPSDFHLFPQLKAAISDIHFQSDDDVILAVDGFLTSQDKGFFKSGIEALKHW